MDNTHLTSKPRFSVAIKTPNYQRMIHDTLADPARANRFIASITSAVAVNPQLQDCEASTILAGGLLGESLGLTPSPQLGQYYLVPFKSKAKYKKGVMVAPETVKAQFVLGYRGYIQLALRSGYYADLDVMEIKQGEYLGKDKDTGKPCFQFIENDDQRDALPVIGYMAYFVYLNGFKKVIYWSHKKMMNHADQYSPAFSAAAYTKIQNGEIADKDMWNYSSYWYKDFDGMAKKTMLRQLIGKWGIMSIEMQSAIGQDNNIIGMNDDGGFNGVPESSDDMLPEGETPEAPTEEEEINLNELTEE